MEKKRQTIYMGGKKYIRTVTGISYNPDGSNAYGFAKIAGRYWLVRQDKDIWRLA